MFLTFRWDHLGPTFRLVVNVAGATASEKQAKGGQMTAGDEPGSRLARVLVIR